MNISLILLKDQFYLSPGREGKGKFFGGEGVSHTVFREDEGGKGDQSSPTEYNGVYSLNYRLGGVGQRFFSGGLKGGPAVANRI